MFIKGDLFCAFSLIPFELKGQEVTELFMFSWIGKRGKRKRFFDGNILMDYVGHLSQFCLQTMLSDIYSVWLNFGQKTQPPLHDHDTPACSKLWMRSAVCTLSNNCRVWNKRTGQGIFPKINKSTGLYCSLLWNKAAGQYFSWKQINAQCVFIR